MTLSELSGRVNSIDTAIIYLQQDLLQRPDITAFSNFQVIWNQSFDSILANINTLISRVSSLYSLYTNLNITVSNNLGYLTGHTGQSNIHFLETWDTTSITGASYTIAQTDNLILGNCTGSNTLLSLPSVSTASGRFYSIKKIDAGAFNVIVTGGGTSIDSSLSRTITGQYDYVTLASNGTQWLVV